MGVPHGFIRIDANRMAALTAGRLRVQMDWVEGPFENMEPGPHGAWCSLLPAPDMLTERERKLFFTDRQLPVS
jgi:hypothetical protein